MAEGFGGGLMDVVLTVAGGAGAAGHEVLVAHGRRPETPVDIGERAHSGVELRELDWGRRSPTEEVTAARTLRRLMRDWRADVIHLHSSLAGLIGTAVAPRGVPIIYSPHSFESALPGGDPARRRAIRAVERWIVRRASIVGAVSPSEAQLSSQLGARRIRVVENGIAELDEGRALVRDLPDAPLVTAGGRTVPQRRPDACARILSAVRDVADVRWIGGSDGRRGAGADGLAATGIPITGWLPRDESLRLLEQATVYLHWTAWDGQALSVLEALSRDAVVVASDIPPSRHVLGPDQVFSKEADAVTAIRRVVADRGYADALRASQRERRGRWSATAMVTSWLELYRACAGNG